MCPNIPISDVTTTTTTGPDNQLGKDLNDLVNMCQTQVQSTTLFCLASKSVQRQPYLEPEYFWRNSERMPMQFLCWFGIDNTTPENRGESSQDIAEQLVYNEAVAHTS